MILFLLQQQLLILQSKKIQDQYFHKEETEKGGIGSGIPGRNHQICRRETESFIK